MENQVKNYLRKKVYTNRKYVLSLIVCADCKRRCLDNLLKKKNICKFCKTKVGRELRKYYNQDKITFSDFKSKIMCLFGQEGLFQGGHRFLLEIPPKSFRNLKSKKRLRAYKEIVKFKMKDRNIEKFLKNEEILLYLRMYIKNYYSTTDCDNLAKSICDALAGILYCNDFQIKKLICEKSKVTQKINEGIVVAISRA